MLPVFFLHNRRTCCVVASSTVWFIAYLATRFFSHDRRTCCVTPIHPSSVASLPLQLGLGSPSLGCGGPQGGLGYPFIRCLKRYPASSRTVAQISSRGFVCTHTPCQCHASCTKTGSACHTIQHMQHSTLLYSWVYQKRFGL